jgi:competence protein ComEC
MPLDEPGQILRQRLRYGSAARLLADWRRGLRRIDWPQLLRDGLTPRLRQWPAQWYLWCPLWLMAGVLAYFALPFEPPLWAGAVSAFLLAMLFAALSDISSQWTANLRPFLSAVLLATLGFTACQMETWRVSAPMLSREIGPAIVTGRVASLEPQGKRYRLVLDQPRIEKLAADETPARIRLSGPSSLAELRSGQEVRVRAVIRPPPGPAYPGGSEFRRMLFFERIGGVGFTMGKAEVTTEDQDASIWKHAEDAAANIRHGVSRRINGALAGNEAAVASALLTGDKGGIPEPVLEDIRKAGIAHLLAISGLHLGVAAGWLFLLARGLLALFPAFALRYPVKKLAAVFALAGALFYLILAGAPVPTIRAFIMIALGIVAVWLDRDPFSLRLVGIAAIFVILSAPHTVPGPSFQMSFAAVTALIASYQCLKRRGWLGQTLKPARLGQPVLAFTGRLVTGVCLTTIIASLATAPFAILHFQQVATFGLIGNLVGVPLASIAIIPLGMVALVLMPFGGEGPALWAMGKCIGWMLQVAADIAAMPEAAMNTAALAPLPVGILLVLLILAYARLLPAMLSAGLALVIGFSLPLVQPRPFMLINSDGDLVGVYLAEDHSLRLSQSRRDRFTAEEWSRYLGGAEMAELEAAQKLRCDGDGCRVTPKQGLQITIARTHGAVTEDCGLSALIVMPSSGWANCQASRVVHRRDILESEGISIFSEAKNHSETNGSALFRIQTVKDNSGVRPWNQLGGKLRPERISTDASDQSDDLEFAPDLR